METYITLLILAIAAFTITSAISVLWKLLCSLSDQLHKHTAANMGYTLEQVSLGKHLDS